MHDPLPDSTIYPSPDARIIKHLQGPPLPAFAAHPVASACSTGSVAVSAFGTPIDGAVVVVVPEVPGHPGRIGRLHRQHTALPGATSFATLLRSC
jgi:hypothetical protein